MQSESTKVVLLGIDGAPFPQIQQWMGEGLLPHMAAMCQSGAFGVLQSTVHPISPIAWNTLVTGQNAGKHGVYDFGKRRPGSYEFDIVNSFTRKTPALWDFLAQSGGRSGVFNVPVTYPPLAVPGYMVSGLLTPNRDSAFTYPEHLAKKILQWSPQYRVPGEDAVFIKGKEVDFVRQLMLSIENQETVVLKLIEEYPDLDFHMFVFMQSDHLHHKLWKYIEENRQDCAVLKAIRALYARLDEAIGKIQKKFEGQPVAFFVVSDHGGGSLERIVSLNRWLIERGWLCLKKDFFRGVKKIIQRLKIFPRLYRIVTALGLGRAAKLLPSQWQQAIATSFTSFDNVDWTRTKAYAYGKYGQIYLNLKGREPQGCVDPGTESQELLNTLSAELLNLEDPLTQEKIIRKVYRREELYHGPHAAESPDLLFAMADYRYDSSTDLGFLDHAVFRSPEFDDTGTHRLDGILIASGEGIRRRDSLINAKAEDLAPTILSVLRRPIPAVMDGKCLADIVLPSEVPQTADYSLKSDSAIVPPELSGKEKEEIESRLRSLGYLG